MKILKALLLTLRDTILSILGLAVFIGIFVGIFTLLFYILSLLGIVGKYISNFLVILVLAFGVYIAIINPIYESFKKHYNKIKENEEN